MENKYAVVNNVVDNGITAVHIRTTQEDANKLALQMVIEQSSKKPTEPFKKEVLEELESNGWYEGNGWSVWVIMISSEK